MDTPSAATRSSSSASALSTSCSPWPPSSALAPSAYYESAGKSKRKHKIIVDCSENSISISRNEGHHSTDGRCLDGMSTHATSTENLDPNGTSTGLLLLGDISFLRHSAPIRNCSELYEVVANSNSPGFYTHPVTWWTVCHW